MLDAVNSAMNLCKKKTEGCYNYEQTPCLEGKICSYFREGDNYDTPNQMNQSRYVQLASFLLIVKRDLTSGLFM